MLDGVAIILSLNALIVPLSGDFPPCPCGWPPSPGTWRAMRCARYRSRFVKGALLATNSKVRPMSWSQLMHSRLRDSALRLRGPADRHEARPAGESGLAAGSVYGGGYLVLANGAALSHLHLPQPTGGRLRARGTRPRGGSSGNQPDHRDPPEPNRHLRVQRAEILSLPPDRVIFY